MSDGSTTQWARRRTDRAMSVVLSLVAVLAAVAALPFGGSFDGPIYQAVAFLAAAAVAGVTTLAARKRWLVGESVALLVGAFFVVGAVAVNGWPSPQAFVQLVGAAVRGWVEVLSTAPPVVSADIQRVVPFSAAFLGAAIGCELARHTRNLALPAVGPLITLVLAILFTSEERTLALIAGVRRRHRIPGAPTVTKQDGDGRGPRDPPRMVRGRLHCGCSSRGRGGCAATRTDVARSGVK